jgi:hypothetical protein
MPIEEGNVTIVAVKTIDPGVNLGHSRMAKMLALVSLNWSAKVAIPPNINASIYLP